MQLEKGLTFIYSEFVYGIVASDKRMKELFEERKTPINEEYHEGQGPTLFDLHEEYVTLDGWWQGDQDNPKSLIVGAVLYDREGETIQQEDIDLQYLQDAIDETNESFELFDMLSKIREVLHIPDDEYNEPKLHLVTTIKFITKEEMENNSTYDRYLEKDVWEYREKIIGE